MRKERERDEGLLRLARGTRWMAVGAVVSAGGLSAAVAVTLPGRSSATLPTPAGSPASTTTTAPDPDGNTGTSPATLTPPTTPPQTTYSPPVVSSGGS